MEKIALVTAAVQTDASIGVIDQLVFRVLQLEGVAERFWLQLSWIEQELVGRDGEQGLGQLPNTGLQEVVG